MSRVRVAAGLVGVVIGTAWLAGALKVIAVATITAAPYVLIGAAVVGAARVLAPPAALTGPTVLLLAGGGWLLIRNDLVPRVDLGSVFAVLLVLGGFAVALSGGQRRWRPDLIRRHLVVVWRSEIKIEGRAPAKLAVTAVLGTMTVTFDEAVDFPSSVTAMEIDVSVFGGRVVIKPPASWKVGPGRIVERAMSLEGTLDWVTPALSPSHIPEEFDGELAVLVNVVGLLGAVALPVRPAAR
jgi:hypothetical protein